MRRCLAVLLTVGLATAAWSIDLQAQRRRAPARKPAPVAALRTAPADVKCPSVLGTGVKTSRTFCDIPAGRDPAQGAIVVIPPHTGASTLSFDLHARHTFSEAETRAGRGFARYSAVIGVLSMKGDLIGRAAVQTEVRGAADLYDRIAGGAGPAGLKAVAPAGREQIVVEIPAGIDQVSLLGETLDALTGAGHETSVLAGRPVAVVSNVQVQYRPKKK